MSARRAAILDSAARLINKQGFSHTSVEDLIDAAGLSGKSHFYHYFKSKDALGYEVLERQFSRFTERGLALLSEPAIQPVNRLILFIDTIVALQHERGARHGSPFGNLAGELADSHEGFRKRLDEVFGEWSRQLEALFGEPGMELQKGATAQRLSRFIVASLEGGMLLARVKRDVRVMDDIGRDLKRFVGMHLRHGQVLIESAEEMP